MNLLTKYGAVFSCLFLLAACETPGSDEDATGTGGAGEYTNENGIPSSLEEQFVSQVGDRVFFALDSSVVTSEGRATLEKQAEWLSKYSDINVVIEGHADERGTREYNLALGERRANAAKEVLVAAGLNPGRITTISYGKERPAVLGSSEQSWSQNRRAVTVLAK